MIVGTVASVSTLLTSVGPAYRPSIAGNGGFSRGLPRLPSSESSRPGLLAADVGAGAAVQDQLERVAGAEDVLAQVAGRLGLGDRRLEDVRLELVLAADVDEGVVDAGA